MSAVSYLVPMVGAVAACMTLAVARAPALKADVAAALNEANAATTTLYHGGTLRGGQVGASP